MNQGFRGNATNVETSAAEPAGLDEHGVKPELTGPDGAHVAARATAQHQHSAREGLHLRLHEDLGGCFQKRAEVLNELGRIPAIDDAVVEGRGQVHNLPWFEGRATPYGPDRDFVDADDGNLWRVDHRRAGNPAKCSEAGDGDGRPR